MRIQRLKIQRLRIQKLRIQRLRVQRFKIPEVVNLPCSSAGWTGSACLWARVMNSGGDIPRFMARHQDQVLEAVKEILQSKPF